jgi:hypothetical protein
MVQSNEIEEDMETPPAPPPNGLYCFFDLARPCGPDCMAYVLEDSESPKLNRQQKNCTILVSVDRISRYVAQAASTYQKRAGDQARTAHAPPPDPRGMPR